MPTSESRTERQSVMKCDAIKLGTVWASFQCVILIVDYLKLSSEKSHAAHQKCSADWFDKLSFLPR